MTDFIRPELRASFWRWRETIIGAALVFLGTYAFFGPGGLVGVLGGVGVLTGAVLVFIGLQRGRFRGLRGGVGSVDVDEGQVTYFGPLTGGAVPLRDMTELALIRTRQTPHWRLTTASDQVFIPVDAEGTDALFDAFTALPGLKVERMLAALGDTGPTDWVIWIRNKPLGIAH